MLNMIYATAIWKKGVEKVIGYGIIGEKCE